MTQLRAAAAGWGRGGYTHVLRVCPVSPPTPPRLRGTLGNPAEPGRGGLAQSPRSPPWAGCAWPQFPQVGGVTGGGTAPPRGQPPPPPSFLKQSWAWQRHGMMAAGGHACPMAPLPPRPPSARTAPPGPMSAPGPMPPPRLPGVGDTGATPQRGARHQNRNRPQPAASPPKTWGGSAGGSGLSPSKHRDLPPAPPPARALPPPGRMRPPGVRGHLLGEDVPLPDTP